MKTGKTPGDYLTKADLQWLQWSPVTKTGKTRQPCGQARFEPPAAMEPGHEDREDNDFNTRSTRAPSPQWSPVTKTGKTTGIGAPRNAVHWPQWSPVTKTGKT